MKKTTLLLMLFAALGTNAQTYSTGTLTLNATNGNSLGYSAKIDVTSTLVTLTLIGPSAGWLGIGFDRTSMADDGDVVIFNGTALSDRHFVGFAVEPELDAEQDWTVTSNTVASGVRTVIGTRARNTGHSDDFTFSASAQALSLVYARRATSLVIAYHGSNSCGSIVSNFTLGTEAFKIDTFKMYPNPSKGVTTIELPDNIASGTVKVYDNLGRVVRKQDITNAENTINTTGLTTGSYMVVLRTDYGNATKTLLVE